MTKNGAFLKHLRLLAVAAVLPFTLWGPLAAAAQPVASRLAGTQSGAAAQTPPVSGPGKIDGTVSGLRACDAPGGVLSDATIIMTSATFSSTLFSDVAGNYSTWLDSSDSPLTIDIGHAGYITQTLSAVTVTAGVTNTQNITLRTSAPCLSPVPGTVQSTQAVASSVSVPMNLTNSGAAALTWSLAQRPAVAAPITLGLSQDASFEDGSSNPFWQEYSLQYGTPLCDPGTCGAGYARTGTWWAWFGDATGPETAAVTQTLRIPAGSASVSFYVWLQSSGLVTDILTLTMDGTQLWTTNGIAGDYAAGYTLVTLDMSAYADGGMHTIAFTSVSNDVTPTGVSFMLDDVALTASPVDCSGTIAWLTIPSTSGSVPAGAMSPVSITFNANLMAQRTYTAALCVSSNDPLNSYVIAPVSMQVVGSNSFLPLVIK